nr:VWA domain-containing protein [Deltaproteobacteria bacterium]
GGTRIGYCLKSFDDLYARNTLSSRTIAIIFSDGWDRGEIDLLRHQMTRLRHKVHKIIWLNPLLGTRDYQPICRGMKTALPFLDYLLPAGHLYDLQQFEKTLEKILV